MLKRSFVLASLLIAVAGSASAQAPPSPATPPAQTAPPQTAGQSGCTPTEAKPQGNISPQDKTAAQNGSGLSDKLAKSDGVLCPPKGVDPEIHAPTPNTGTMPVIPPPGSPGGDQTVRPK